MSHILVKEPGVGEVPLGTQALVDLIQKGDGMGWPGDPRMYIVIGVLEKKNRWGTVIATGRRYEVKRLGEDGKEHHIGHWRLEERDQILFDLTRLRMDSPGHIDSGVLVDAHNAKLQKDAEDEHAGWTAEALAHRANIHDELTNGKSTFRQVGGLRDEPKGIVLPDSVRMGD